jgi:aryl-alcohol dehydrogenase-like predicted oxidoreductase
MEGGCSRRNFIRRSLFGAAIGGLLSRATSTSAQAESHSVDRRRLGRIGSDVSILGLGLGGAFMDGYEHNLDAGRALLESALAKGINYWDTARSYGPSEGMIAPVLARNRDKIFLASKSDARDYEGFKRDLNRSLQVLRTDRIDLYLLHDIRPGEWASLNASESGAVRAAREAKDQKIIRSFGITGHSGAGILIECMKRFDPDAVLTIFPATRPDKGRYEEELLPLARSRKIGVIAMKAIRYGRQANLPAKELLRYALSLDGVHTAIVGLDSLSHLNENAAVASSFRPMKEAHRFELYKNASSALAGVVAPWDRAGYFDGRVAS